MAHGTVLSFSPEMISSGPRSGFLVSTLASVPGWKLAVAAWNSGTPDPATEYFSYRPFDSSSETALPNPNRNCLGVKAIARPRLRGFLRTGKAARSAESGSGSTPRNGAGSIATATLARPRPASFWVINPPNEWPMMIGSRSRAPMMSA